MEKDIFDYVEEEEEQQEPANTDMVWNILTIVVLVMTLCVGVGFLTVFINPNVGLNPFPPPTMPQALAFDTPTPTPKQVLPPTWTAIATEIPPTETPSPTPAPTDTTIAEVTATTAPEGGGDQPEQGGGQPAGDMSYVLMDGNPQYLPNLFHAELGCNWFGVGGQTISLNSAPVTGVVINLGGELAGETLDLVTITGIATQYGPAGYEFDLTEYVDGPVATSQSLWIRVLDQAGNPLSDKIYFDTFEDCEKSTIVIYMKQTK